MLGRLVSYLFLSAVLMHTFSQAIIVADYLVNTELITKVFCVNKEKPKMHCNGKCHLAKQLKKDEEKKSDNFEKSAELVLICQSSIVEFVSEKVDLPIYQKDLFTYNEPIAFECENPIFHPPTLFV